MKKLFHPLFVTYCLLWGLIHILRRMDHRLPFINDHLTDFLFVPVVAHITVIFTRRFIIRNKLYCYPFSYLLFIASYTAIVFEVIMPKYSVLYTRDVGDVLAYFLGSFYFYYIHQEQALNSNWNLTLFPNFLDPANSTAFFKSSGILLNTLKVPELSFSALRIAILLLKQYLTSAS